MMDQTARAPLRTANLSMDTTYDRLRQWRRERAREIRRPAYFVLSNAHLEHLALACPTTEEELAACPGFGPKRLAEYGEGLLALLRQAAAEGLEAGVEPPAPAPLTEEDLAEIAAALRQELVRLLARRFRNRFTTTQLAEALSALAVPSGTAPAQKSPRTAEAGGGSVWQATSLPYDFPSTSGMDTN